MRGLRWMAVAVLGCAVIASAQEGFGKLAPEAPAGKSPEQIIEAFAARETTFANALPNYTWRQDVKFQTLDDNDKVDGEYHQITDIGYSGVGHRTENVVFAPQNTIERLILEQKDFDDLEHRLPFVMTTADLPKYNITYVGRQKVDEIDTYVFDAEPKVIEKNERYFKGRLWVDQTDMQIVLVSGKNVPDDLRRGHESLSPPFTTYYAQVDGKYWFPIYTKAEGILHFASGPNNMADNVHTRSIVRYSDYKQFRSTTRLIFKGKDITDKQPEPEQKQDKR